MLARNHTSHTQPHTQHEIIGTYLQTALHILNCTINIKALHLLINSLKNICIFQNKVYCPMQWVQAPNDKLNTKIVNNTDLWWRSFACTKKFFIWNCCSSEIKLFKVLQEWRLSKIKLLKIIKNEKVNHQRLIHRFKFKKLLVTLVMSQIITGTVIRVLCVVCVR